MTLSIVKDSTPDLITVPLIPRLEIVSVQTIRRNCYVEVKYRVRSMSKLSKEDLNWLLAKGFFMHGQTFFVRGTHDGSEKEQGRWTFDGSSWVSFYEYSVTCACDSGD